MSDKKTYIDYEIFEARFREIQTSVQLFIDDTKLTPKNRADIITVMESEFTVSRRTLQKYATRLLGPADKDKLVGKVLKNGFNELPKPETSTITTVTLSLTVDVLNNMIKAAVSDAVKDSQKDLNTKLEVQEERIAKRVSDEHRRDALGYMKEFRAAQDELFESIGKPLLDVLPELKQLAKGFYDLTRRRRDTGNQAVGNELVGKPVPEPVVVEKVELPSDLCSLDSSKTVQYVSIQNKGSWGKNVLYDNHIFRSKAECSIYKFCKDMGMGIKIRTHKDRIYFDDGNGHDPDFFLTEFEAYLEWKSDKRGDRNRNGSIEHIDELSKGKTNACKTVELKRIPYIMGYGDLGEFSDLDHEKRGTTPPAGSDGKAHIVNYSWDDQTNCVVESGELKPIRCSTCYRGVFVPRLYHGSVCPPGTKGCDVSKRANISNLKSPDDVMKDCILFVSRLEREQSANGVPIDVVRNCDMTN